MSCVSLFHAFSTSCFAFLAGVSSSQSPAEWLLALHIVGGRVPWSWNHVPNAPSQWHGKLMSWCLMMGDPVSASDSSWFYPILKPWYSTHERQEFNMVTSNVFNTCATWATPKSKPRLPMRFAHNSDGSISFWSAAQSDARQRTTLTPLAESLSRGSTVKSSSPKDIGYELWRLLKALLKQYL